MKQIGPIIVATLALLGYAGLTAFYSSGYGIPKVSNPYGLTQWELDHITNPEVQQHIEIIKSRQSR